MTYEVQFKLINFRSFIIHFPLLFKTNINEDKFNKKTIFKKSKYENIYNIRNQLKSNPFSGIVNSTISSFNFSLLTNPFF